MLLSNCGPWRVLTTPSATGADNMALDHALMRWTAASGEPVLRVYGWSVPTLSFGRHQQARDVYDRQAIQSLGVAVVRRPTGGRAVLHHREITYSVVAPLTVGSARLRVRDVYAAANGLLVDALLALGAPVALARETTHPVGPALGSPCFNSPAAGEIVAGGRKLVGSAQWREGSVVLQHGSILIDDDQSLLARLSPHSIPKPVATLHELLGRRPSADEVAAALRHALDDALEQVSQPHSTSFDPDVLRDPYEGLRTHYADPAWTWRK